MAQVHATSEAEPQFALRKKTAQDNHGNRLEHFNEHIDNLSRIAGKR
jgi:hypothetical protein